MNQGALETAPDPVRGMSVLEKTLLIESHSTTVGKIAKQMKNLHLR